MSDEKKIAKISPAVLKLSETIAPAIKIAKDGTVEVEKELYLNNLPEGLTKETLEQVQGYNSDFFAATAHAFGHAGIKHMKTHKDAQVLSASFDLVGKDTWSVGIERQKSFPNPADADKPITSYGVVTGKLEVNEARFKVGQLKQVKIELGDAALKALA